MSAPVVALSTFPRPRAPEDEVPWLETTKPVWEALHPLLLTERMQVRLRAAVEYLLADPALAGASDSARLAVVVLAAKTSFAKGSKRYLKALVTAGELGRWLGVEATTVRHDIRPRLQRGAVFSEVIEDPRAPGAEYGRTAGLSWEVEQLRLAQLGGDAAHPLALTLPELVTLLRLLEALFAPGWSDTPAGLLARRKGRDAATDRLALLLATLNCRPDGSVRLCAGAVDRRGRLAATVARWLGSDSAVGERALRRLEASQAVCRTESARGEGLLILGVTKAWKALKKAQRAAGAAPVQPSKDASRKGMEGRSGADGGSGASAGRDQIRIPDASSQVSPYKTVEMAAVPSASLHASHAPREILGDESSDGFCCSGSWEGGDQRCGVCAHEREDQAHQEPDPSAKRAADLHGASHPLRGEKQTPKSPSTQTRSAAVRRTPVPPPAELQKALGPVAVLWDRLGTSSRRELVVAAARVELATIDRLLSVETPAPPGAAAAVLAARLQDRLALAGGPDRVSSPVGWLLHRGLPPRGCGEDGCTEGWLLHRDRACPRCEDRIADRRALRDQAYRHVAAAFGPACAEGQAKPGATRPDSPQLTAAYERILAERSAEVAATEQQRIDDARARREEERKAEQARAAAERELAARPCADCCKPKSAGLCGNCRWIRDQTAQLEQVIAKTVDATVAARPDLANHTEQQHLAAETERALRERIAFETTESVAPELLAVVIAEHAFAEAERRRMEVAAGWIDPAIEPTPPLLSTTPFGARTPAMSAA